MRRKLQVKMCNFFFLGIVPFMIIQLYAVFVSAAAMRNLLVLHQSIKPFTVQPIKLMPVWINCIV